MLVSPTHDQVLRIQARQNAYYFSAACDVVLRKRGFVLPAEWATATGHAGCMVTRETEWAESFAERGQIFEGCLAQSTLTGLGLQACPARAERLDLEDEAGRPVATLLVHRYHVRRIPAARKPLPPPRPFESPDPYWNQTWFDYQSFSEAAGTPLLWARNSAGERQLVGLRRGRHVVLGVPVLDFLVRRFAVPPFGPDGYFKLELASDLSGLEDWLVELVEEHLAASGAVVVRLATWPGDYRAALTVRHDYDRPITTAELHALLDAYETLGIKSTWFWRLCVGRKDQIATVRQRGHEVALHTEVDNAAAFCSKELEYFRKELGFQPAGYSAHGGRGAAGYLGLDQIDWARNNGLTYGELLGISAPSPRQSVVIRDGAPASSTLVLPTQHRCLDSGMKPEAHCLEELVPAVQAACTRGEHSVVMNHPDIHVTELLQLLQQIDRGGVWNATLAEICGWYRRVKVDAWQACTATGVELCFREALPSEIGLTVRSASGVRQARLPAGATRGHVDASTGQLRVYFDDRHTESVRWQNVYLAAS